MNVTSTDGGCWNSRAHTLKTARWLWMGGVAGGGGGRGLFGKDCGKGARCRRQRRNLCLSVSMSLLRCLFHPHADRQHPARCSTSGSKRAGLPLGPPALYSMLPHLNGRQSWTSADGTIGDKMFEFLHAFETNLAFRMGLLFFSKSVFICKTNWADPRCCCRGLVLLQYNLGVKHEWGRRLENHCWCCGCSTFWPALLSSDFCSKWFYTGLQVNLNLFLFVSKGSLAQNSLLITQLHPDLPCGGFSVTL